MKAEHEAKAVLQLLSSSLSLNGLILTRATVK